MRIYLIASVLLLVTACASQGEPAKHTEAQGVATSLTEERPEVRYYVVADT